MVKVVLVNIKDIKFGDTIIKDGIIKTVRKKDIKHDSFMGTTLFGDSYSLGRQPVQKIIFYID